MDVNRLLELRKSRGLSQEKLSDLVGVSRKTYCHWEHGERYIRAVDLKKLASVLNVPMEYLMGDGDDIKWEGTSSRFGNIEVEMEIKKDITTVKMTIPQNVAESDINKIFNQIANLPKPKKG